ncbi:acetyltransferase [Amycolatopsis albispora]|uniref:Acetyltransferase n=1 Tax=Amycolatopsis albispora TaxID=1804986 RepID=A0A344LJY1_9PSEU|nr:acetyltransferase [Amycolatopsis albispora]
MREATRADLPAIAEIYAHYVRNSVATFELTPPDAVEWERRFDAVVGAGLPFLVAESGGAVAGYAYCVQWKPRPAYRHSVENSIYLAPEAAGQGLGGALLDELLARCAEADIRQVIAVIADTGDPSSAELHRRRGFREVGRLSKVGFKHGRWLDTGLWQKELGSHPGGRL